MTDGAPADAAGPARERILEAAGAEFTAHGLAGARVDRIAERAGVNKQLLYYYFGSKQGLFDAVIAAMTGRFRAVTATLPDALAERLPHYAQAAARDRDLVRLLEWEALEAGEEPVVREDERRAYFAERVGELAERQAAGDVPRELDPAQLFLAFQALSAHPFAFPQMTRHVTGLDASDPAFLDARRRFLEAAGRRLLGGE